MKMLSAAVTLLMALTCLCAKAETYYVSSKGNDVNSGLTQASAWASIEKVNATPLAAGDTVLFEGEVIFSGSLGFGAEVKGTAEKPIVLGSYGVGRAVIRSGQEAGFWLYNTSGFKIEHLVFEGAGRTVSTTAGMDIYMDLPATKLPYIAIHDVEVYGYREAGISIGSWGGTQGFSEVTITNSAVHDNGDAGILVWAEGNYKAHRNVYVGFTKAYNNAGIPTKTKSHSGNGIILGGVDGGIVEYCEAYNNGWLNAWTSGGPVGIWCYASNNVIIQYNESHHNKTGTSKDGGGFDLDGGSTNCILQYNYSHDNEGAGYLLAQYSGASEMKNLTIRYNISENDGRKNGYGAIHLWSSGSKGGIQNAQIYNNTIYLTPSASGSPKAVWVQAGGATAATFRNNLFVTTGGARLLQVDVITSVRFEGNNYWASGEAPQFVWGGTAYNSLDGWRSATTQEYRNGMAVGYFLDPMLKSPGKGVTISDPKRLYTLENYKLESSSPIIGKALNLAANFGLNPGNRDFWGNSILQRTDLCIGAHQATENSKACLYGGPQPLRFGQATGGTYAGPGVEAGLFTPDAAGVGNHPLTYTYTDVQGLQQVLHHTVMVIDAKETAWTGDNGTSDWFDSQNWTTCVPTPSIDAHIPPTTAELSHYPRIKAGTHGHVSNLDAAGPLTLEQNATLEVHGSLTGTNLNAEPGSNVIFNSDSEQLIPGGTYDNLIIRGSGIKKLAGAATITQAIDLMQGSLWLGAQDLTLTGGASLLHYSAERYIVTDGSGKLTQHALGPGTSKVYPVGTPQGYAPVTLVNTGATDNFSVRVEEKDQTQEVIAVPDSTINKTWHIEEEETGGSEVAMTLQWTSHDEPANFNRSESYVSHYEGEAWQVMESSAGTVTQGTLPGTYIISLSGVNSFSPFTVASTTSAPAPLPVSLVKFTAARQGAEVLLQWETASEENNYGFEVEVSEGPGQFRKIGFVPSYAGNAQRLLAYTYRDAEAGKAGTRYYRLRQIDHDSTSTYSPIRAVSFGPARLSVSVYPNPFSDKITLEVEAVTEDVLLVVITDTKGKKVLQRSMPLRKGLTKVPISLAEAEGSAFYFLTAYIGDTPYRFKLIKK
ncbi:right-handed parallel beta-helix repeat-containing protein [Pontibacter litorisediminis]|uniref:right-handed parallel beta-helix repeat-containing protein n=1 Tax=Pontibacter litorisediminis TaxID=1846260 RepID=UPI0023ED4219|nr:right-handed parallel beta-helix repeat-containing protein [Pontibacter litorisediminis]